MAIDRVFLGFHRPCLAVAVDYLVERFGAPGLLDLENVILATPGGRAGRRLEELLVEKAEQRRLTLSPPTILTVGRLPEKLYPAKKPFADDFVQQLAWIEALKGTDPDRLARLISAPPADDDFMAALAMGEMLGRLHRELAGDGLDFNAVADCGSRIEGFREHQRWEVLAEIQKKYLATLDRLELWDLQTARLYAIREGECETDADVILVGTVDINNAQRLILDQVADRVTALIFAPEETADRFDDHGCLVPAAWQEVTVDLEAEQIEVVDSPPDQAAAVVRWIAALDGRYRAEEITVGVPDEQLVPYVEHQFQQCEIPARYGVGRSIARTSPYRFLAAVADYLEGRRFSQFAALVRHPALHDWLAGRKIRGDWLSRMDEYYAHYLPPTVHQQWLARSERGAALKQVYEATEELLGKLAGSGQPLSRWGEPILEVLVSVFGRRALNRNAEPDRTILSACEKIHQALQENLKLKEYGPLEPNVTGAGALRVTLHRLEGETIAPVPDPQAVELLGWLELPLDDAPALAVTQFNEGAVPASLNADLFLPDQLRRQLGLEDNDRRYARDAYALSVLAASRARLKLIAGRRTAQGDPLAPSRLLFACDEKTTARRALWFFNERESRSGAVILPGALQPGGKDSKLDVPRPKPLAKPVTSMRVTEFRDYLACPYRYYLRHCLKLSAISDDAAELDPAAFGSLAHEVLGDFGAGPAAGMTDAEGIRKWLNDSLDRIVGRQYGKDPLPAVLVQIEQLRLRLMQFAQWQADWAGDGWRIEHVETSVEEGDAFLPVDGAPMGLRGRIDRIDVNQATGRRVIFDYKTSDTPKTPEKVHRNKDGWIDLQLPLYRYLATGLGIQRPVGLGYIVLPKDTSQVGARLAEWTEEDFQDADHTAADVIRRIRAEEFGPPTSPPPAFFQEFAAICQDDQFGAAVAAARAEGDQPQ